MSDDTRVKTGNAKTGIVEREGREPQNRAHKAEEKLDTFPALIFFFHAYNTPRKHGPTGTLGEGVKESSRKRYLSCEWMERSW